MHKPLLDLIATGERILGRLTRNEIRRIQPVMRQDLDLLHELVAKLDAGFEASKDRPNWTGPIPMTFLTGLRRAGRTTPVGRVLNVTYSVVNYWLAAEILRDTNRESQTHNFQTHL